MQERTYIAYTVQDGFEEKLERFVSEFVHMMWLTGSGWNVIRNERYKYIMGLGCLERVPIDETDPFEQLQKFVDSTNDWIFGHFGYDLKNRLEKLSSHNPDQIGFPDINFFRPHLIFRQRDNVFEIGYLPDHFSERECDELFAQIVSFHVTEPYIANRTEDFDLDPSVSKKEYNQNFRALQQHIQNGDIYQANYCQEFSLKDIDINAFELFRTMNSVSKNPFNVYYRTKHLHALSTSPERFVSLTGKQLFSQPMKGTAPRSENDAVDHQNFVALSNSEKDRRENVMIVDLVRNDLSKVSIPGSVRTTELCVVKTFPKVHQMVSSIEAELSPELHPLAAIEASFPMGSMTGAPKMRAMEIIEDLESTKRGLYSGAIGYFSPEMDFDFNVVIRTFLYNSERKVLSAQVGGGITALSNAKEEYEECLVKLRPLQEALRHHFDRLSTEKHLA